MYRPPPGVATAVQPSGWQIVVERGGVLRAVLSANDAIAGPAGAARQATMPSTSSGAAWRLSIRQSPSSVSVRANPAARFMMASNGRSVPHAANREIRELSPPTRPI